jgi:glycosyltransferase involved in cell wall biosynthesis
MPGKTSENGKKLHIAIMGTRGVPGRYGGFETFAEELSTRLVKKDFKVTVYSRKSISFNKLASLKNFLAEDLPPFQGVNRRASITIFSKYLETPLAALSGFIDGLWHNYDLIILCNAACAPFAWIKRSRLAINVDGIERKRSKWNILGRLWYRLGEWSAVKFSDQIISDGDVIAKYYQEKYDTDSAVIRYGASCQAIPPGKTLAQFNLEAGQYILYVARLEPENNALGVIEAFVKSRINYNLIVVGDAPYATSYKSKLKLAANKNVIFAGYQFGDSYRELRANAMIYIQASQVGGTHPALVEAMAYGNSIIANDVPEHREVLGEAGLYYSFNNFDELSQLLVRLSQDTKLRKTLSEKASQIARRDYSWEKITKEYLDLILKVA